MIAYDNATALQYALDVARTKGLGSSTCKDILEDAAAILAFLNCGAARIASIGSTSATEAAEIAFEARMNAQQLAHMAHNAASATVARNSAVSNGT